MTIIQKKYNPTTSFLVFYFRFYSDAKGGEADTERSLFSAISDVCYDMSSSTTQRIKFCITWGRIEELKVHFRHTRVADIGEGKLTNFFDPHSHFLGTVTRSVKSCYAIVSKI